MLFPGDVLHYYFAATDHVAGDARTAYVPADRTGFGNPEPLAYPGASPSAACPRSSTPPARSPICCSGTTTASAAARTSGTAPCVPEAREGMRHRHLHHPRPEFRRGQRPRRPRDRARRSTATRTCCTRSGDLGSPTLSNGDFNGDPGNDLGLLNDWFALGGRDLFMTGDDLAHSLYDGGQRGARAFLETRMGLTFNDTRRARQHRRPDGAAGRQDRGQPGVHDGRQLDRLRRLRRHQRLRQRGARAAARSAWPSSRRRTALRRPTRTRRPR